MNLQYLLIFTFLISACNTKDSLVVSGFQSKDPVASTPVLDFTGATGTSGSAGMPMSVSPTTLDQNGADVTNCSITPALPAGLSIHNSTCVISGTPSGVLPSTVYSVVATNIAGSSPEGLVTLDIAASVPSLSYAGASGTVGLINVAMSVAPTLLQNNGHAISNCAITPALPSGLSLHTSTCLISGTLTTSLASTLYSVVATNSLGTSSAASVTLAVNESAAVPTLSYALATGTSGNVGVGMSVTPTTLNNNGASITSCVTTPALSVGLSINTSNCVISGAPTGALSSTVYSIVATNAAGNSAPASVTLSVAALAPSLSYVAATGTTGNVGSGMLVAPTTLNNNGAAITNCSSTPALPAWASIGATNCIIFGSPTSPLASTTYSIVATNSVGNSSAASVTLSVAAAVPTLSYVGATGTSGNVGSTMLVIPTTVNHNGASITNCVATPALSVGLNINTSTCVISGTPTGALASTTYSITATNSAGNSSAASITLSVGAAAPTLSYLGSPGTNGNIGVAMSIAPIVLLNNGAAITNCSASPSLPVWASINPSNCVISGTPTEVLPFTIFSITATNSAGNSSAASVTLYVAASVPTLSYASSTGTSGTVGVAMSVTPTTLNENGASLTHCVASPSLPSGISLNSSTCVISGTPTASLIDTVFSISAINSAGASSAASVTLSVAANAPTLSYAGATGTSGTLGLAMSVSPTTLNNNGAAITNCVTTPALSVGLSINTSTCVISGTASAALASTTYSVVATNSAGSASAASVTLSVAAAAPTLSYLGSSGTNGNIGAAMSVTPIILNNNGAAITNCSASPSLPVWASINPSNCVISGTPSAVLPFSIFSVTATNSAGNSSAASITLSVGASVPTLSYASATGTSGNVGVAMSVSPTTLNDNGASITNCVATPALSVGLSLNTSTCVISGAPTGALSSTVYSVTATNSAGNSSAASVTLSVAASVPILSYASATGTSGSVGVVMSVTPTTLNNNGAAITNCVATPALSVGLSINTSTCVISGTPTGALASTTYSVVATNSAGNSSAASVTLSVAVGVPTLSYASATGTSGSVGVAMSVSPTTLNNNGAAITNCTASPALSVGLSLNTSTCVISGTPTGALASTTYSITATNSAGSSSAASVTLIVSASVPILSYSGATGTSGNVGVAMSVAPTTLNNRGAAITNCVATPALSVGLSINTSTCVISGTPTGALVSTTYSVVATNSAGNSSASSITLMVINCPGNYAQVPANSSFGVTNAFCVAQFEMKNVSGIATSQAASAPWVSISQTNAKTACTSLGAGYDLISNPEWMTIAYEIEKTASNWSSGVVGTGMLSRGHSDSSPGSALDVTNTSDPYIGTGNNSGSGWEQKRRHTVSNGQIIWDFSGNVWEWANWTLGGPLTSGPTSCSGAQFPSVSCGALSAADYMPGNPGGAPAANYNSNYGLGYFIGGSGGAALRGGHWGDGTQAGAFALHLYNAPSDAYGGIGFRCVFRP